ncbi:GTP-binding protein [Brachybacterium sp. EF45031]|uniref:CobW family GTP-binding protein n=1 Tax=Brachybacterium sillae TaxID=2810536 RepID=UPI00217D8B84|nr:GTP-binding protein [Brachybacterium sillae]MCS6712021.1 GTP-binding protein [Brachybacterium sillae]
MPLDPHAGRDRTPGPDRDHAPATPLPLAVVCAIDQVLRDSVAADLLLDTRRLAALRYDVDRATGSLRRLVLDSGESILDAGRVREDRLVELDHECVACAMREDAVPVLEALAATGRYDALALVLPISADPLTVSRTLGAATDAVRISTIAAVVDSGTVVEDVLGDATLAERDLRWALEDERSVGEALCAQVEVADLVIDARPQPDPAGAELLAHLLHADQELVTELHSLAPAELLRPRHDASATMRRADACAAGDHTPRPGLSPHGTWTVVLRSERPFHPGRFLQHLEALGAGRLRSRGRFWVPTRPGSVCEWNGAGGQVSVGAVAESAELPTTCLVMTGIGEADRERVRRAFARCLLTDVEWRAGLAPWLGRADELDPWLGRRDVAA